MRTERHFSVIQCQIVPMVFPQLPKIAQKRQFPPFSLINIILNYLCILDAIPVHITHEIGENHASFKSPKIVLFKDCTPAKSAK